MKENTMNKFLLAAATFAVALFAVTNTFAAGNCVFEGKPNIKQAAVVLAATTLTIKVDPKQDLNVYLKPGAAGNSSNTLVFRLGTTEVSRTSMGASAGGNGQVVVVPAPLLFDNIQVVPVSNTANPSLTVVQGR